MNPERKSKAWDTQRIFSTIQQHMSKRSALPWSLCIRSELRMILAQTKMPSANVIHIHLSYKNVVLHKNKTCCIRLRVSKFVKTTRTTGDSELQHGTFKWYCFHERNSTNHGAWTLFMLFLPPTTAQQGSRKDITGYPRHSTAFSLLVFSSGFPQKDHLAQEEPVVHVVM